MSNPQADAYKATGISLRDQLRKRLAYHESKAGQYRDAIAALDANPGFESVYQLVKNANASRAEGGNS